LKVAGIVALNQYELVKFVYDVVWLPLRGVPTEHGKKLPEAAGRCHFHLKHAFGSD
jgi:hypothetical protein